MNRLRQFFQRRRLYDDLDEEIAFHLEQRIEELVANGVSVKEATAAARREFGNVGVVQETARDVWGWRWLEDLFGDLRFGARMLRKNPGFTAVAVLTLALGIGANTAIFSLLDAVMLRALPVRDPEQLVLLQWHAHRSPRYDEYSSFGDCASGGSSKDNTWGCSFSSPMFDAIHAETTVFDGVLAFAGPAQLGLSGNGPSSMVSGEIVSGNYFDTLGIRAALGRTIRPWDDAVTASSVVVVSYGYWQGAFGGSPSVIGKMIRLNGVPFTIVGVAEPGFTSLTPGKTQDLWLARYAFLRVGAHVGWSRVDDPANAWLTVVARLKPGLSSAQARAEASLVFRNEILHGSKPLADEKDDPSVTLLPAQEALIGRRERFKTPLYVLMFSVGLVLLITCANIAGLLLARSSARGKEIAVRFALGAGRTRIARQLLTESVLLSVFGGLLGVFVAYWGVQALTVLVSSGSLQPFPFTVAPDIRVLAFTTGVSILTGILCGLVPALRGMRVDLTPALRDNVGSASGKPVGSRWLSVGSALVIAQVALAVVVLTGAGLVVRTLTNLESINPGFDSSNVLVFGMEPALSGYDTRRTQELYRELQAQFAALPAVISVSYSSDALLTGDLATGTIRIEGQPDKSEVEVDTLATGPGFFDTMRIPVLAGRVFHPREFAETAASSGSSLEQPRKPSGAPDATIVPVVVNDAFARRYFEKQSPLGMHLKKGDSEHSSGDTTQGKPKSRTWEVIGVVGDAKYDDLRREIHPTVYLPVHGGGAHFELRTAINPTSMIPVIRSTVARVDSNLPLFEISSESQEISKELFQERLVARLSSFFGLLGLLLACIGIYGLLSYDVTRRNQEIGIRMALGAERSSVLRSVMGRGIGVALAGVAIGTAMALATTRYLQSLLYGVRPSDPITFITVATLLLFVVFAACYIPARRATRVEPMVALRYE